MLDGIENAFARAVGRTSKSLVFVALPDAADDVEEQLTRSPVVLMNTDIEPDGRLISYLRQAGFIIAGTSFSTNESMQDAGDAISVVDVVRRQAEAIDRDPAHDVPGAHSQAFARDRSKVLTDFAELTSREQLVLSDLMDGHRAIAIAERAYVSIATVRTQIRSILQKLGVNSQLAAVALARQAGWAPPQSDSNPRAS